MAKAIPTRSASEGYAHRTKPEWASLAGASGWCVFGESLEMSQPIPSAVPLLPSMRTEMRAEDQTRGDQEGPSPPPAPRYAFQRRGDSGAYGRATARAIRDR